MCTLVASGKALKEQSRQSLGKPQGMVKNLFNRDEGDGRDGKERKKPLPGVVYPLYPCKVMPLR